MPPFHSYLKHLRKNSFPFACPHCNKTIVPEEFENHCSDQHQLRDCCVWCFGNTVWLDGEINVHHLLKCFQKFAKLHARMTLAPVLSNETTLLDLTPMCLADTFFDHEALPEMPTSPVWPVKIGLPAVPYQDPSLNLAAYCLHMYLSLRHQTDWFHVMVRPAAFPSFLKALDDGQSRTMPFYCYCDGGDARDKGHRHMIVVSEKKGRFAKLVWKKIECVKKNLNIRKQAIESPMQFVNLLGLLSQRRSKCTFTFEDPMDVRGATDRHFYVAQSLPPQYRIALAAQWDGGLLELVNQEYSVADPKLLAPHATSVHGVWGIRIRNLPGICTRLVLPVEKNYYPVSEPTDQWLCLSKGEKLYFEETAAEEEEQDNWVQVQADKGNAFFSCIGDEIWFPTPYQQKCINLAKPLKDRIVDLEQKLEEAEAKAERFESDKDRLNDQYHRMKRKFEESDDALKHLQQKHIKVLERENDVLRMELKNQK